MSLFRAYRKNVVIHDGLSANLGNQLPEFKLVDRGMWLEGMILKLSILNGASAIAGYKTAGLLRALDSIQIRVDEREDGPRNVLSVSGAGGAGAGIALAEYAFQEGGFLDNTNLLFWNRVTGTANARVHVNIPIFFRNPLIPEPFCYNTCLPLPRYGSDPVISIKLGSAAEIATTFTPAAGTGVRVEALLLFRDVVDPDGSFPHWKTDFASVTKMWPVVGRQSFDDLPTGGLYTGILAQNYSASYAARANGAAPMLANFWTDDWTLEVANRNVFSAPQPQLEALSAVARQAAGGAADLATPIFDGSFFLDFISDVTMTDTFHLRSALDASVDALKGGKIKLLGNIGTANVLTALTYKRLLVNRSAVASVL